MSDTKEELSSSKRKSPMSATEEDSPSSKSKSPMSSTDESMSSSKAISTEGGVEEDGDEDYDDDDFASDANTIEIIDYLWGNDPRQALSDDDPGRGAMTADESNTYAKQIRDSDGFDIDTPPAGVRPYGTIYPYPEIDDACRRFTEFAIQRQTSDESRKLKLKRIIKWNQELASPVNYYITFEAEDLDTGEVETYQTKVERMIPVEETEVPIFRVKPCPTSPIVVEGSRDWCGLPAHLIGRIMIRLSLPDYIRCRFVCTSWLFAAAEEVPYGPTNRAQYPFLLLPGGNQSDDSTAEFRTLVSPFSQPQKTYRLHLPQIRGRRFLGSSDGWLITADDSAELYLLNPLTGAHTPLPSLTTLSAITGPGRDDAGRITGYYTKDEGYEDKFRELDYFQNIFFSKVVVVSSSTTSLVVTFIIQHEWHELAWARPGDEAWTELKTYSPRCNFFLDVILHKRYFYAVSMGGVVVTFDIDSSPVPEVTFLLPKCNGRSVGKYYLVESLDGAELMLIWRHENWVPPEDQEYDGVPHSKMGKVFRTTSFQVFELDPDGQKWIEMKKLPEATALFLGDNRSEALSAQDLPELRRNCIYFTDGDREQYHGTPRARRDVGVFDLTDGTIRPLFPRESSLHRFTWPPPIWFPPRLS